MGFQNFAYIFGAVIVVAIVAGVIYSIALARKIQKNGIEADAVLTRVETHTTTDSDGDMTTTTTYYVTYINQEGQSVEAALMTEPPRSVRQGASLRVKYLPEKPKSVVLVKR
ncbi:MAG: hypothetical protein IJQ81_14090 [Oscillibacter sp.]|nr:hypothetical protein [Oscillibacter sp.]